MTIEEIAEILTEKYIKENKIKIHSEEELKCMSKEELINHIKEICETIKIETKKYMNEEGLL